MSRHPVGRHPHPERNAGQLGAGERRAHRAERKRLQDAAAQAQDELRRLRPLGAKVAGLRVEAERLRRREAELIQARDRAVARAEALAAVTENLERECREARHRLAALTPEPAKPEQAPNLRASVTAIEVNELPDDLLAGRTVFYFTGELRRSSAEAAAQSLRALGASDIRTFCLRQGSDGPDGYPADALIIADFRFAGHSQSGLIQARAARSAAQFLSVRSGKGSLVRTVARALISQRQRAG